MSKVRYVKCEEFKREASIEEFYMPVEDTSRRVAQVAFNGTINEAKSIFTFGADWGMSLELDGDEVEYRDYSSYLVPIYYSDWGNGKVSVTMTQLTQTEQLIETIYGGINNE